MDMQTRVSDAERVAIEKEITDLYNKTMKSAENVDISDWDSLFSDAYNLGVIDCGVFYKNSQAYLDAFREGFKLLERQVILETPEFHLAVLAPDVVVGTNFCKWAVYYKDGKVFTGNSGQTWIFIKINGQWKLIHHHQSMQPVE